MTTDKKPDDAIDAGEKSSPLDRREFGKFLTIGVSGLALGMSGCATTSTDPLCDFRRVGPEPHQLTQGNSPDVIVIGAGLSGLIAARRLLQGKGNYRDCAKSVILLEAENYVGGRMSLQCTANGYALDMGGQWVGGTQRDMQALVDELNICHFTSYEKGWSIEQWRGSQRGFDGSVAALLDGQCTQPHLPPPPAKCEPALFPPCPTTAGPDQVLMGKVWRNLLDISARIDPKAPWAYSGAQTLDQKTFADWLKEQLKDATDPAKAYTEWLSGLQSRIGGSGGFEPDQVSMLHMAWTQRVGPQAEMPEEWLLKGGAGQIPAILKGQIEQLTRSLYRGAQNVITEPFRLGEAVLSVVMTNAGYFEVKTRATDKLKATCPPSPIANEGDTTTYYCREVIVAIPPPLRQRIDFRWESSAVKEQMDAHKEFSTHSNMGSMSKVHLIYDRAFWRDELCLSGSVAGDKRYLGFIADSSLPSGVPGVLTAFIAGNHNTEIESWSFEKVRDMAIQEVWEYFGKNDAFRNLAKNQQGEPDFHYRNWNTRKWACGAFTSYLPMGTWTGSGEMGWREPVGDEETGRIFFAGTESSDRWPGYYDGAIRAGKRAALAILGLDPESELYDPGHDSSFPTTKWHSDSDLAKCEKKDCKDCSKEACG